MRGGSAAEGRPPGGRDGPGRGGRCCRALGLGCAGLRAGSAAMFGRGSRKRLSSRSVSAGGSLSPLALCSAPTCGSVPPPAPGSRRVPAAPKCRLLGVRPRSSPFPCALPSAVRVPFPRACPFPYPRVPVPVPLVPQPALTLLFLAADGVGGAGAGPALQHLRGPVPRLRPAQVEVRPGESPAYPPAPPPWVPSWLTLLRVLRLPSSSVRIRGAGVAILGVACVSPRRGAHPRWGFWDTGGPAPRSRARGRCGAQQDPDAGLG